VNTGRLAIVAPPHVGKGVGIPFLGEIFIKKGSIPLGSRRGLSLKKGSSGLKERHHWSPLFSIKFRASNLLPHPTKNLSRQFLILGTRQLFLKIHDLPFQCGMQSSECGMKFPLNFNARPWRVLLRNPRFHLIEAKPAVNLGPMKISSLVKRKIRVRQH